MTVTDTEKAVLELMLNSVKKMIKTSNLEATVKISQQEMAEDFATFMLTFARMMKREYAEAMNEVAAFQAAGFSYISHFCKEHREHGSNS